MQIDSGKYNKSQEEYDSLVQALYAKYPEGITLPPEYAQFVLNNQLRFLIRLARYKFASKMLNSSDQVLEVGCGSGIGSLFMAQHCAHVTAIDVKKTEICEAKQINLNRRKNVKFRVQDLFDLPSDQLYDVVVSLDVLEHMNEDLGEKFIKKIATHIHGNGMLIIGTPSFWSYEHQGKLSRSSHVKCYDLPELRALIDPFVQRTITFSMNDEVVHTGHHKMAWYYFIIGFGPRRQTL